VHGAWCTVQFDSVGFAAPFLATPLHFDAWGLPNKLLARFWASIKASFGGNFTATKCPALVSFEILFSSSYRTWKYAANTINEAEAVRVSATGTRPKVFAAHRATKRRTWRFLLYIWLSSGACMYMGWYGMV